MSSNDPTISRSQGIHGSGRQTYTPWEYVFVVDWIKALETHAVVTVEQLYMRQQLKHQIDPAHYPDKFGGNTVRAIVSDAEMRGDLILGGTGQDGYRVALSFDDACLYTDTLKKQVKTMQQHIRQRTRWAKKWFAAHPPTDLDDEPDV